MRILYLSLSLFALFCFLTCTAYATNYYPSAVMKDNPTNYWRLGETTVEQKFFPSSADSVYDSIVSKTGNYNNVFSTMETSESSVLDDSDQATYTSGRANTKTSYIALTPQNEFNRDITMEFWFSDDNAKNKTVGLVGKELTLQHTISLTKDDNNRWKLGVFLTYTSSTNNCTELSLGYQRRTLETPFYETPTDNLENGQYKSFWHHVAVTSGPEDIKIYVDGNLAASKAYTECPADSLKLYRADWDWHLSHQGSVTQSNPDNFQGGIDEFALYNKVLDGTQIWQHYNLAKKTTSPLGFVIAQNRQRGRVGENFVSQAPTAFNGSANNYSISPSLPPGLYLNTSTGAISGTYTGGPFQRYYRLSANSAAEQATTSFLLKMLPQPEQQFQPLMYFDSQEKWRPLDVDKFLSEGQDYGKPHRYCSRNEPNPATCSDFQNFEELRQKTFYSLIDPGFAVPDMLYIDIFGDDSDSSQFKSPTSCSTGTTTPILYDCNQGNRSATYYHKVAPTPDNPYAFVDYWNFYRYNEFVGLGPDDTHEGDWEGMSVAYSPEKDTFEYVSMASHRGIFNYLPGAMSCDGYVIRSPQTDTCGTYYSSEKTFIKPKGQRMHTYISQGSHATYPYICEVDCKQDNYNGFLAEKRFDGKEAWGNNFAPSSLKALPQTVSNGWDTHNLNGAVWTDWAGGGFGNGFSARWGRPVANPVDALFNSPTSPGMQGRYHNPGQSTCTPTASYPDMECENTNKNLMSLSDQELCKSWAGPGIQQVICLPNQLRQALKTKNLNQASLVSQGGNGIIANGIVQSTSTTDLKIKSPQKDKILVFRKNSKGKLFQKTIKEADNVHTEKSDKSTYLVNNTPMEVIK